MDRVRCSDRCQTSTTSSDTEGGVQRSRTSPFDSSLGEWPRLLGVSGTLSIVPARRGEGLTSGEPSRCRAAQHSK
jgi:hypothetical protein